MWRLLQRPVAQGAPRLVGRPTRGSGESRAGRKCQIESLRKINQGEGSEGGRQWRRCDWASGEQRWRSQLRQLRVWGRWGKHPLLCSGWFEIVRPLGMALVDKVRYNIIKVFHGLGMCVLLRFHQVVSATDVMVLPTNCSFQMQKVRDEDYDSCGSLINMDFHCMIYLLSSNRQVPGEEEMVGPGGWNNGRLSLWTGVAFNFPLSIPCETICLPIRP